MVKERKKYERGAATKYISRAQALRKLQLSLADFRKLCILKGIYPQVPNNKKAAAKGKVGVQTFYFLKDIRYISHEPIINTFREFKIFMRRLKKAKSKQNYDHADRIRAKRPEYKVDHIVKERYPSFIDAVRDLDDCLSLCFMFATFPINSANADTLKLCRRITVEFVHYVIASRSLRKVFVSIKGIYYQAEIMGQSVTWIVPHKRAHVPDYDVDFKVMRTFVEFYTTFLGFVNFQLYHNLNLHYPPKLENVASETIDTQGKCSDWEANDEMISALASTIQGEIVEPVDDNVDEYPITTGEDDEAIRTANQELLEEKRQRNLFDGLKFFINQECPWEDLTFMLRSFGGVVSWTDTLALGAAFPESDETITHHIVDRPSVAKQYISRYYVQPQWIFDSINARRRLPESDYFMGAILPPHFSPFITVKEGEYDPHKRHEAFQREQDEIRAEGVDEHDASDDELDANKSKKAKRKITPKPDEKTDNKKNANKNKESKDDNKDDDKGDESDENSGWSESEKSSASEDEKETTKVKKMRKMRVDEGKIPRPDRFGSQVEASQEKRLGEMMIPKKKKWLYERVVKQRKRKLQAVNVLEEKRNLFEKTEKRNRIKAKKAANA